MTPDEIAARYPAWMLDLMLELKSAEEDKEKTETELTDGLPQ